MQMPLELMHLDKGLHCPRGAQSVRIWYQFMPKVWLGAVPDSPLRRASAAASPRTIEFAREMQGRKGPAILPDHGAVGRT